MAEHIRNEGRDKGRRKPRKRPISRHPLFPATVALWFAALFGLGSLIIRPVLLESLVLALHIDALIPAAAPPLGVTARMLLALGMTALGGVVGLIVARRIPRSGHGAARTGPAVETADAEESPLWSDLKTRRRSIAAGLEEAPSEPEASAAETDAGAPGEDQIAGSADPVLASETPAERRAPTLLKAPTVTAADRIASAELCELSHVELLERLALSLEKRRGRKGPAEAGSPLEAVAAAAAALMPEAEFEPEPEPAPRPVQSPEPARTALPRFVSSPAAPAAVAIDTDWNAATPNRFLPAPHDADEWDDADEDDTGVNNTRDGYSSLLMNLSRPVPFDGSAAVAPRPFAEMQPKGPEETERALRAALATLQRMSGAA